MENVFDLNHTTLSEKIKNYLIDCIINKDVFKPGDKIVETQIAKDLNVSQAPVREAIKELNVMGFIESQPYKGSYVKEISVKELIDQYKVREKLEILAVEEAYLKIGEKELERMQYTINKMMEAAQNNNYVLQAKWDSDFHNIIVGAADNSLLQNIYTNLGISYWILKGTAFLAGFKKFKYESQALRHQPILDVLKEKDLDKCIKLIEDQYKKNIELVSNI